MDDDDDFLSCISVWKLTQHWLDGDDGNNQIDTYFNTTPG